MSDKNKLNNQDFQIREKSPIQLLLVIIFSIFICEILIMIFIKSLPSLPHWGEFLIDSVLLSVTLLPVLYFFAYRPLRVMIAESRLGHAEILKLKMAIESSAEAIFITDHTGLITYINPEFTIIN